MYSTLCRCISAAKLQKKAGILGCYLFFYYFCSVNGRISWIDWAKAMAVCAVVFCHLPQSQEYFYFRYAQSCVITVFFFVSGYLKKDRGSTAANWRKYWYALILPYIVYNILVYPAWMAKYYMMNGGMPALTDALKPVAGALLLQHQASFAEPLNGPLWYLPAVLAMHLAIDCCRKGPWLHGVMTALCVVSFFLYAANKYWEFWPQLTPMGIIRRLPYYYLGYLMARRSFHLPTDTRRLTVVALLSAVASLLLFHWHLHEQRFLLHIALFYLVNICFLVAVLAVCRLLGGYRPVPVVNLSVGTLAVVGLHSPLVSMANWLTGVCHDGYRWYEAVAVTLVIVALIYPVILFGKQRMPVMVGKVHQSHNQIYNT